jgi:hypothetical protein
MTAHLAGKPPGRLGAGSRPAAQRGGGSSPVGYGGEKRACQEPYGQILPPWAWSENEAPATRAARRPVTGI